METEKKAYRAHCLVISYPIQSHVNPMLQFSKRTEHLGVKVTLVTTRFFAKSITHEPSSSSSSIVLETISDGYDEGGRNAAESYKVYLESFRNVGSETLTHLIEKLNGSSGCPVDCIVYDVIMPWCLEVAKKFGLRTAAFFTQSCAVDIIYYHVYQGLVRPPLGETEVLAPGLPLLQPEDLPSFIHHFGSHAVVLDMLLDQYSNIDKADWVLCNTFYELEQEEVDWMANLWPLMTIGPTIPSMYLDQQLQDNKDYGFCIFKPDNQACMNWLNDKPKGSVVYVSFGSTGTLGVEQMEELYWGLRKSDFSFLWVVKASKEAKFPQNFIEGTLEKGLVVSWCPQLAVLAHEAVGCFVTHCGWNSTLEALSLGVPMVAMPRLSDQTTNAKYIMDVWKSGVRVLADEKGIVGREVIKDTIKEVMEGKKGRDIKANVEKWKKLAKAAVDKGGSSDKNISQFVANLAHS